MHAGLFLGIWVLHEDDLGAGSKLWNLGQFNVVIDALTLVLEVEARVLEGAWKLDDRLAQILDLFLARYLNRTDALADEGYIRVMSRRTITWIL